MNRELIGCGIFIAIMAGLLYSMDHLSLIVAQYLNDSTAIQFLNWMHSV